MIMEDRRLTINAELRANEPVSNTATQPVDGNQSSVVTYFVDIED